MPSNTSPIRSGIRASTVASQHSRQPLSGTTASSSKTHNHKRWYVKPRPPPTPSALEHFVRETKRCVCAPTNRYVERGHTGGTLSTIKARRPTIIACQGDDMLSRPAMPDHNRL
jgi:hypothetical protein